jgi:thiamine-phosphate pyrophosphorylase
MKQLWPAPSLHIPFMPALSRGLYLLTPETADTAALLRLVDAAIAGGTVLVQYRDKSADAARRATQAAQLQVLCSARGVPLVINDDAALAQAVGASGVHLGEDDGDLAAARARLGADAIIGASCYDSLERAAAMAAAGADYLAFGSFFPSPTKPAARRASLELLRDSARLGKPRVAIGGITPDNAPALVAAGADLLAVISAVADAADPRAAAQAFARMYAS